MVVFVDTSALYSILVSDDINHEAAKSTWTRLLENNNMLVVSNYVALEACALLQRRIGIPAVRLLQEALFPVLQIEWVDESIHEIGLNTVILSNRRDLSMVDCTSFVLMKHLGITKAFTFDPHFKEQGFECLP